MKDKQILKEALKKYKKDNYQVQSWDKYNKELATLSGKIVNYIDEKKIKIDAIIPILRGGNIPATFLSYTLNILTILPVQYKYFFVKN